MQVSYGNHIWIRWLPKADCSWQLKCVWIAENKYVSSRKNLLSDHGENRSCFSACEKKLHNSFFTKTKFSVASGWVGKLEGGRHYFSHTYFGLASCGCHVFSLRLSLTIVVIRPFLSRILVKYQILKGFPFPCPSRLVGHWRTGQRSWRGISRGYLKS